MIKNLVLSIMIINKIFGAVALQTLIIFLLLSRLAYGSDISLRGFLQGNYSLGTANSNPDKGNLKWAEERLQLKVDINRDPLHMLIKTDAFYGHVEEKADIELREGYLHYNAEKWDARIGRQIITWGLGDLIFINDIFPKDYEAFFAGRPLEYLKKGSDGVKIGAYPGFVSFEFVAIPFFEPNNYPNPKRFWMFDPMPGIRKEEKEPAINFENPEFALRMYRDFAGFDASVYHYRGFFRQPSLLPDNPMMPKKLTLFYPELSVYGASLQGRAIDGLLSLEAGYYDSREDRDGTNPMVPNPQIRYLTGYQRQLWEDFTIGVQYYGEYMQNHSNYKQNLPAGFPEEKKQNQLVTMRLTQFMVHQTLSLSLFTFYSSTYRDYMLNPSVKYNFSDHIWAAIGGNVFGGGKTWTQFGQLDKNDNVYLQMRYEF